MNRFTVVWSPDADDELTEIWNTAKDRQAVSDASNAIERHLATDPVAHAQHLSEGLYRIALTPLAVLFHIEFADAQVKVVSCKLRRFP